MAEPDPTTKAPEQERQASSADHRRPDRDKSDTHRLGWAAILLLALAWRLLGITTTEVWRDEATTIIQAQGTWLDLLTRLPKVEDTPPLMFLTFKAWSLISDHEWFLRLLPVLLGVAWVDMTMRTARLICPRAWWAAGLFAAFSQVPVHYSQEIRGYSLLLLLTASCFWAAERALRSETPRRWLFVLAGLAALTAHCHMAGVFVLPAAIAYLLVRAGGRRRDFLRAGPLVAWCAAVAPLVWYAQYWSMIHKTDIDPWWIPPITWSRSMEIAANFLGMKPLARLAVALHASWAMWGGFAAERLILFGCAFLAVLGLLNPRTRKPVIALAVAAATMLGLLVLSGRASVPNVLDRTVLPAWSPLVLALAIGTAGFPGKRARAAGVATLIAVSTVWAGGWAWTVYQGPPRRPPTRELFAQVAPRIAPADLIFSWPRWYKELTVYRLRGHISGEQVLDEWESYAGKPPRHRLERVDPRQWRERFAKKIETRRGLYGSNFSVWIVQLGMAAVEPGGPDSFLMGDFAEAERYDFYSDRPMSIVRYVPKSSASESMPAVSAAGIAGERRVVSESRHTEE